MDKRRHVSAAEAKAVFAAVRRHFGVSPGARGADASGPDLRRDYDFGWGRCDYAIVWEGGPSEWTTEVSGLPGLPDTVWTEPQTSWALGIWPV